MARDKMLFVRVSQDEKEIIANRWRGLGFVSQSEYMLALLKADNPGMDPARKLKGLKRGP